MSSSTRQRRRRQAAQNRLQNRPPSVEEVDVFGPIVVEELGQSTGCIDLTAEDDVVVSQHFVDLTNTALNDSPIVILGSSQSESPPRLRRRIESRAVLSSGSESDSDLLELPPFTVRGTARVPEPSTSGAEEAQASSALSPERVITCPVCLDTEKQIRSSGRRIFSTNCGHVFCNECISDAIKSQKRCPSCRKKITLKQIHPLFI